MTREEAQRLIKQGKSQGKVRKEEWQTGVLNIAPRRILAFYPGRENANAAMCFHCLSLTHPNKIAFLL